MEMNDLKKIGTVIKINNEPHIVIESQHSKSARSKACMRTKLKNLITNSTIEKTFNASDKVESADMERTKASFMDWVVDSLENRQSITVVDDQWNNPTWTVDLARIISRIIDHEIQGLYHYGGRDLLNRFAFAEMIAETFKLDRTLIEPIDTASLNQLAKRPLKSGLRPEKIEIDLGVEALPLQKALNEIYSLS